MEKQYYIYFLKCNGSVKIGKSTNIKSRICNLQVGNPEMITLLHKIKCNDRYAVIEVERTLHTVFAEFSTSGEWFVLTNEIKDFINGSHWLCERIIKLAKKPGQPMCESAWNYVHDVLIDKANEYRYNRIKLESEQIKLVI